MDTDFIWSATDEPHASRRKLILEKYPQIKQLYGVDPTLKFKILLVIAIQIVGAWFASTLSWWPWFALTYCVGGTFNHTLTLAMHEVSHNLAFSSFLTNKLFGIFTNCPLGIPSFISFKKYHADHHKYQGEDGVDGDIPSTFEGQIVHSTFTKLVWVICQPAAYALRPLLVVGKPASWWELVNAIVVLGFDAILLYAWGIKALLYCVCGTLLGMGLHPMAGHFIAEHYTFSKKQETYSYYGILNLLSFNVGYHNEHHDFPFIAGSKLPQVKAIAPEFYDTLMVHTSWVKVIWMYITDPTVGPYSRVKRHRLSDSERRTVVLSNPT